MFEPLLPSLLGGAGGRPLAVGSYILCMNGIHMLATRLKDVEDDAFVTLVDNLFQHGADGTFFFIVCLVIK